MRYFNVKEVKSGAMVLSVEHLFGIFTIYLFGVAIASIIFILEMASFKLLKAIPLL